MKKYLILLLIPFLFACGRSAKKQAEKLQAVNDSLITETMQKDEALNEFIASINDIQSTLDTIKMKENIITLSTDRGTELQLSAREQIKTDIMTIYSLMLKNKNTLIDLQKKLKTSGMKTEELQKMVDRLTLEIKQKNTEIEQLRQKLAKLNIEIEEANLKMDDMESTIQVQSQKIASQTETIESQQTALNTAYYIIGVSKDLKKSNIIKGETVLSDFDKNLFTRVNIQKTTEIPIMSKKAKIVSNHPTTSYELVGDKKTIQSLKINDPKLFWSNSKFLVIVID
jgi:chromosome segregation ATPase